MEKKNICCQNIVHIYILFTCKNTCNNYYYTSNKVNEKADILIVFLIINLYNPFSFKDIFLNSFHFTTINLIFSNS